MKLDIRLAMNAVSDVIQNRPQPLREFDQIYMKAGDLEHVPISLGHIRKS